MCGIAGIYLKSPEDSKLPPHDERERFIDGLLKGIEHRGKDATGVVALQRASTQPHLEKADITASKFIEWRKPLPENSRIVLLHTRAATQGSPTNLDNNHPVVHKTCYVTHNGHIRNDDELFEENKIERIAQVDSEAISALIHKHGLDKVHLALQELEGGFAIAAVQPELHPDVLVLAKGRNSPLHYLDTSQALIWASTISAIQDAWKAVWDEKPAWSEFKELKEGELLYIEDGQIEKLEFKVKQYYVPPKNTSSTVGGRTGYWPTRTVGESNYVNRFLNTKNHRRTCKCGHSQWKHLGMDLAGGCIKGDCRCTHFVFHRYLTKREWKRHEDYKRVQEDRIREENRKKAERKRQQEERERRIAARSTSEFDFVKGQLKISYKDGVRSIYDDDKLVAVQFKCDGCTEWRSTKGRVTQGHWKLCIECWGEECDLCGSFFDPNSLTKVEFESGAVIDEWYLCKECYHAANTADDGEWEEVVKSKIPVESKDEATVVPIRIGQSRGQKDGLTVDNMCIKLTAEELACKASFLYELLFEFTEDEIKEESWMEQAYSLAVVSYRKNLADLRSGLPSATSKALALTSRGSEDEPRSPSEALAASEVGVRVFTDDPTE